MFFSCVVSPEVALSLFQTLPYGTGNTRGPGRGKAKEKGIVLSMGWRQCPLIHQSSVCSGEGPCPWGRALPGAAPMGLRGPHCPQPLAQGQSPGTGSAQHRLRVARSAPAPGGVPGCPGSSSSAGTAPGTAQLSQPSPRPCSSPAMSET